MGAARVSAKAHEETILVLQGGGALGAYQAGVYEALSEAGYAPDWITGVSIGAINAALIAGNPPERRVPRLREFWELVSSGWPIVLPAAIDPLRLAFNRLSANTTATFGVPGFFMPRIPPPFLQPDGMPEAMSFYDTSPLLSTLRKLVDFDLINDGPTRFSVGVTHVASGNSKYFDNRDMTVPPEIRRIGPEHVMASGALPPGLGGIEIQNELYWDGGIVSNTPLWYVLDDSPQLSALIFQVDLFSASGVLPCNLDQVLERQKDIQYSSKTRLNTNRAKEMEALRDALHRVLEKLPKELRDDPDVALLTAATRERKVVVAQLINRRFAHSSQSKDYEFSRTTVRMLWDAGREAVRTTLAHPDWAKACHATRGVRSIDLGV